MAEKERLLVLDVVFGMRKAPSKLADSLYEKTHTLIDLGGYGSEQNVALCVNLRRRWWMLHLCYEKAPDFDLLQKDIRFWRVINMRNEVRELQALVLRSRGKIAEKRWCDAVELLS